MECSQAAAGFETALAKVSTLADTSVVSMDTIKAQLVSLSGETGVAVESLAEATYQALSAGVDTANVVDFVSTATKLSVAGFTESATAVDVVTTALNAYGLAGSDAEKVASMLVKTQDLGKTSVGELAATKGELATLQHPQTHGERGRLPLQAGPNSDPQEKPPPPEKTMHPGPETDRGPPQNSADPGTGNFITVGTAKALCRVEPLR